jgi:hypothetical protein
VRLAWACFTPALAETIRAAADRNLDSAAAPVDV